MDVQVGKDLQCFAALKGLFYSMTFDLFYPLELSQHNILWLWGYSAVPGRKDTFIHCYKCIL